MLTIRGSWTSYYPGPARCRPNAESNPKRNHKNVNGSNPHLGCKVGLFLDYYALERKATWVKFDVYLMTLPTLLRGVSFCEDQNAQKKSPCFLQRLSALFILWQCWFFTSVVSFFDIFERIGYRIISGCTFKTCSIIHAFAAHQFSIFGIISISR